jgi:hypothetical protein
MQRSRPLTIQDLRWAHAELVLERRRRELMFWTIRKALLLVVLATVVLDVAASMIARL